MQVPVCLTYVGIIMAPFPAATREVGPRSFPEQNPIQESGGKRAY